MQRFVLILAVMAVIVLGPAVQAADTLTGVLVDSACYATLANKAVGTDHAACALACAQKGHRLGLLLPAGTVYMVTGALTQNNNAKLIPLLNRPVVITGTIGVRVLDNTVSVVVATSDGRRPTGDQDGVVEATVRKGDFREGDVAKVPETIIEAISIQLVAPPR